MFTQIQEDYQKAFRDGEKDIADVLRLIKAALMNAEIEKRGKTGERDSKLSPEEGLAVLKRYVKQLEEAKVMFIQAGRMDLVDKYNSELKILGKYLPVQLSEDEVRKIVSEVIGKMNDTQKKNFGQVMGVVMKELGGKAEGSLVSRIIKELLGG